MAKKDIGLCYQIGPFWIENNLNYESRSSPNLALWRGLMQM